MQRTSINLIHDLEDHKVPRGFFSGLDMSSAALVMSSASIVKPTPYVEAMFLYYLKPKLLYYGWVTNPHIGTTYVTFLLNQCATQ